MSDTEHLLAWIRKIKLATRWYAPVFEFIPDLPENQGMILKGTEFEDKRPRVFLHTKWQSHEQEFIDYFKKDREHQ